MFLVIDGVDGTGKTTQLTLLKNRLEKEGCPLVLLDFPRYGEKSAGPVEDYLNGNYGSAAEVGPYRASIFYAIDRYAASLAVKRQLQEGKIILANRYVSANLCHQGGKIKDQLERQKFFAWAENLEYNIFAIPRPDLTLVLYLDPTIAQQLVDKKPPRDYLLGRKRDLHEADLGHLKAAAACYLALTADRPDHQLINCAPTGALLTPEKIHEQIWQLVSQRIHNQT